MVGCEAGRVSLFFTTRDKVSLSDVGAPSRVGRTMGSVRVNEHTALAHSAVWASLRLRADLISSLPVDVFRRAGGVDVQVPTPPVIATPDGGEGVHWRWATQFDLDRCGNTFGLITARDGFGIPARVELVPFDQVVVEVRNGVIDRYRIAGTRYDPADVWHERQYAPAGMHVGLSPVAQAAMSVGQYLSAQQFALDWFANGSVPAGRLKNTQKTVDPKTADVIKTRFKTAVGNRDLFVHGSDWDYEMISVPANEAQFIEAMNYGATDVCRFFGVPANAIDAASPAGGSITYANITQDSLRLLVQNLGPAIARREAAWSRGLVAAGRHVKLNSDAILRLDPPTRQQMIRDDVAAKLRTYSEARALMNLPPLTDADLAEFAAVAPAKPTPPPAQGGPSA